MGLKNEFSRKPTSAAQFRFISCNDSLLAGTTLTLRKSQAQCSGVMQRWACSSLMSAQELWTGLILKPEPAPTFEARLRPKSQIYRVEKRCGQLLGIKKGSVRYSCRWTVLSHPEYHLDQNTGLNPSPARLATLCPLFCLQRQVPKLASWLFYCWSLLCNNNVATNLLMFTSSYDISKVSIVSYHLRTTLLFNSSKYYLFFISFHCPQHFHCSTWPTYVPASLITW